jgi:hypothetical protein
LGVGTHWQFCTSPRRRGNEAIIDGATTKPINDLDNVARLPITAKTLPTHSYGAEALDAPPYQLPIA